MLDFLNILYSYFSLEAQSSVPRPKSRKAFRESVRAEFDSMARRLWNEGKTPAVEIARELNVSRQTADQYLTGNNGAKTRSTGIAC